MMTSFFVAERDAVGDVARLRSDSERPGRGLLGLLDITDLGLRGVRGLLGMSTSWVQGASDDLQ